MSLEIQTPFEIPVTSPIDTRKRRIACRREVLITSLQRFYNSSTDIQQVIPILKGEHILSLRLIDWFVTTYAKRHNTSYSLDGQEFLVYLNYKSQLKAYSKKLFDPFCRRERIQFQLAGQDPFFTTVGQLNFFRWAIEKKILEYIRANFEDITKEEKQSRTQSTNSTNSTQSSQCTDGSASSATIASQASRRRRTEKEISSIKTMHKHDVEICISFD